MTRSFQMAVLEDGSRKIVDFANNTPGFVEVILEIDGKPVKGYCYPPYHHKPIRRTRTGEALPFSESGHIRALIYRGTGTYKDNEDSDVPPFIRFKLNEHRRISTDDIIQRRLARKVTFRRTSPNPIEVLEIPY